MNTRYVYSVLPSAVHHQRGVLPGTTIHIRDFSFEGYPRSAGLGPPVLDGVMLCQIPTKSPHDMVNAPEIGVAHPENVCSECVKVYIRERADASTARKGKGRS
jgi:hypothetical protein